MTSLGAPTPAMAALPWRALTKDVFIHGMIKMDLPLPIPAHNFIRNELYSLDFAGFRFQLNSDFISNSNLNPSGLLPNPYMSLGAPPPCIPMPISPQN
jgi:hypothetical protein